MQWKGIVLLLLGLVVVTALIAALSPAFAIFPAFVLFLVAVSLFFRPLRGGDGAREVPLRPSSVREMPRNQANTPGRRDEDIAADVMARLTAAPGLSSRTIEAQCRKGRVTLWGNVTDEAERERARAVAAGVPGVLEVSVQLRLQPPRTA